MRNEVQRIWGPDMRRRRYYGRILTMPENVSIQPYRLPREAGEPEKVEVLNAMPPGVVTEREAMENPQTADSAFTQEDPIAGILRLLDKMAKSFFEEPEK